MGTKQNHGFRESHCGVDISAQDHRAVMPFGTHINRDKMYTSIWSDLGFSKILYIINQLCTDLYIIILNAWATILKLWEGYEYISGTAMWSSCRAWPGAHFLQTESQNSHPETPQISSKFEEFHQNRDFALIMYRLIMYRFSYYVQIFTKKAAAFEALTNTYSMTVNISPSRVLKRDTSTLWNGSKTYYGSSAILSHSYNNSYRFNYVQPFN